MRKVSRRTALATISTGIGVGMAGCLSGDGNGDGNGGGTGDGNGGGTGDGNGGSDVDQLVHLGFGGTLQEARAEVAERWTEKSGIEVVHESAASAEEFITMIKQNPETYDVVTSNDEFFFKAGNEDVLQPIDLEKVPNFEENTLEGAQSPDTLPMNFNDEGKIQGLVRETVTTGFAYNANKADGELTSWDALLKEQYNGTLSLLDRPHYRYTNAALALGMDFYEALGNDDQMTKIEELLIKQNEQAFNYFSAADTMMRQLRNETAHISEAWGGRILSLQKEGAEHIKYVIPDEGTVAGIDATGVPANAADSHLDAIHDYLNFQYREESLQTYPQHTNYPTPMANPNDEIANLPGYTDNLNDFAITDYGVLGEYEEEISERFELIKTGEYEP